MKKGNYCPLLKKDCIETKCAWYGQVRGTNPNTGQDVDTWECVINLLPMLLIENSHKQAQTGAAVESFRNESLNVQKQSVMMMAQALQGEASYPQNVIEEAKVKLL
jgi:hypothetical protein